MGVSAALRATPQSAALDALGIATGSAGSRLKARFNKNGVTSVVTVAIKISTVNSCWSINPLASAILAITSSMMPRPFRPMPSAQLSLLGIFAIRPPR